MWSIINIRNKLWGKRFHFRGADMMRERELDLPNVNLNGCPVFPLHLSGHISVFYSSSGYNSHCFHGSIKHLSSVCHVHYCCCNIVTNITGAKAPLGCIQQYPPFIKQFYVISEKQRWTGKQRRQGGRNSGRCLCSLTDRLWKQS